MRAPGMPEAQRSSGEREDFSSPPTAAAASPSPVSFSPPSPLEAAANEELLRSILAFSGLSSPNTEETSLGSQSSWR